MSRFKVGGGLILALTLGTAALVHAGAKWTYPLTVSPIFNGKTASGAVGSIRFDGTNDYLGCWADVTPLYPPPADPSIGANPVAFCSALSATGGPIACTSSDPGFVKLVQTIGADSYIVFNAYQVSQPDPRNGTCTYLNVENYSGFAQKVAP